MSAGGEILPRNPWSTILNSLSWVQPNECKKALKLHRKRRILLANVKHSYNDLYIRSRDHREKSIIVAEKIKKKTQQLMRVLLLLFMLLLGVALLLDPGQHRWLLCFEVCFSHVFSYFFSADFIESGLILASFICLIIVLFFVSVFT